MGSDSSAWLRRTRQQWKLAVFYALMIAGAVFFLAFLLAVNGRDPFELGEIRLSFAFIGLVFSGLVWLCLSIRCPHCGCRPVWPILKSAGAGEWIHRIESTSRCPDCGHQGDSPDEAG